MASGCTYMNMSHACSSHQAVFALENNGVTANLLDCLIWCDLYGPVMAPSGQSENPMAAHSVGAGCIVSTESWKGPWRAAGLQDTSETERS